MLNAQTLKKIPNATLDYENTRRRDISVQRAGEMKAEFQRAPDRMARGKPNASTAIDIHFFV